MSCIVPVTMIAIGVIKFQGREINPYDVSAIIVDSDGKIVGVIEKLYTVNLALLNPVSVS